MPEPLPEGVDAERIYDAVYRGVYDAMWAMITNATQMPCNDFYDSVKADVTEAVVDTLGKGAVEAKESVDAG